MSQQPPNSPRDAARDADRVRNLQNRVRDRLGTGPSLIETPEEARKTALLQKVRDAG